MTEVETSKLKENLVEKINKLLSYNQSSKDTLNNFEYLIEELIHLNLNLKDYVISKAFFATIRKELREWPRIGSKNEISLFLGLTKTYFKKSKTVIENVERFLDAIIEYKINHNLFNDITVSFLFNLEILDIKKFLLKLPNFGEKKVKAILSYYFKTDNVVLDPNIILILNRIGIIPNNLYKITDIRKHLKAKFPEIFEYNTFYNLKMHFKKICTELNPLCNKCSLFELCNYDKKTETLWIYEDLKKENLTVVELFSGTGGMIHGFLDAGFIPLLAIDFFKSACRTLKENHPKTLVLCEDITKIRGKKLEQLLNGKKPSVIIGGPPCQGFSIAGKQDPRDPRNSLFMEFVRILDYFQTPYFVMENVPGLLSAKSAKGESVIDIIIKEFEKIGYKVKPPVKLNAANYGVPQARQRVIIVGTNTNNRLIFPPKPTHTENPKVQIIPLKKWVPVKSVLFSKDEVDPKYMHTQKMIEGFKNRKKRNEQKGKGYGWQILDFNKPSYTISARYWKDGSEALVKYNEKEIRMLTTRECARIQTFPDNYKFLGSKSEIYTQIGNAVPCLLALKIAQAIKKSINSK